MRFYIGSIQSILRLYTILSANVALAILADYALCAEVVGGLALIDHLIWQSCCLLGSGV